jgi:hypothetical protein
MAMPMGRLTTHVILKTVANYVNAITTSNVLFASAYITGVPI